MEINDIDSKKTKNNCLGLGAILIDMQEDFLKKHDPNLQQILINRQAKFLDQCVEENIPVAILKYKGKGKTIYPLRKKFGEIPRKIRLEKEHNGGFTNPELYDFLDICNVQDVYVLGINAGACVKETAEGALKCSFGVISSSDLIENEIGQSDKKDYEKWYRQNTGFYDTYSEALLRYKSS